MIKPTLVIMAAGKGSRYGGPKQIDPVGPNNEIIMEYSIYDAIKAGFGRVVFVINKEMEEIFEKVIVERIAKYVDTAYAFQEIANIPINFEVPPERIKPWGTGHAVLCCKGIVNTPFAVINADDFYGPTAFKEIQKFLLGAKDTKLSHQYAMVGFAIENTLSVNGTVARGICRVDDEDNLQDIFERTMIKKFKDFAKYLQEDREWINIPKDSIVSMNIWGFTPSIFPELEAGFQSFLVQNKANILKSEYLLPGVVDNLIKEERAKVKVLTTKEQWYGVTYKEDKPIVKEAIKKLIASGVYPEKLWDVK